jgi:endonuclease III
MPRGVVPRQPARTGRQDKVRVGRTAAPSPSGKNARVGTGAPARPGRGKASAGVSKEPRRPRKVSQKPQKTGSERFAAKGYNPIAPERVAEILQRLDQLYPEVTCALTHSSAWELLVATILSAQSTDANVNRVTPELFRKYPTVQAFAALTPEQLEPDVRSTGFFRNKSKSVVGAAKKLSPTLAGRFPTTWRSC